MLRIGKTIFGLLALTILLGSCWSKKNDLGHDIPSQLVCRFTEGVLTEPGNGSINVDPSAFVAHSSDPFIQHLNTDFYGNFFPLPDNAPLKFKKGVWYKMEIFLFDGKNNPLNQQFLKPDQIEKHQFFFNLLSDESVIDKGISYYYSDFIDGHLLDSPVGFTGYIRVNQEVQDAQLRLLLVHLLKGDKYEADGKPNPFDKPSPRVLEFGDLTAFMPFKIEK
ncbi:hypothetical protein [Porphyromonas gingivalis]|uniref:Lipoprotein n=1 Tax=Porphyromonas gingivalis (strain ATCC 33277 / DSM 20709 / CIP 103683 / JCM 12257 / NCTC 11834 / 2561) TaxID=431947 RepID=B2RLU0_PORG3|nr:hypothetical protein [Porphyromonas gingivalis]AIJ34613.1 hypothetical protein EG14_00425 [Porphyromonas gingivalis]ALJ26208.1 hypothetical protein PGF_00017910 [Porphyromonas gingivalis 381]AUR50201.1 hypothetical protein CF001_1816 [Porphyromonas gingivalis ATCC 33277]MCE8178876.1 hypothetical protein [Porphyromonas gingivalis]MDR4975553.1 hypothetical protein [Porphyromonas gingivalis]